MGEGVDGCRTKGIDFLMAMIVKGAIGHKNYTLFVALCLAASYHVGIISGDAVTCLDGCFATIQEFYLAVFIHHYGGGGIVKNYMCLTEDIDSS